MKEWLRKFLFLDIYENSNKEYGTYDADFWERDADEILEELEEERKWERRIRKILSHFTKVKVFGGKVRKKASDSIKEDMQENKAFIEAVNIAEEKISEHGICEEEKNKTGKVEEKVCESTKSGYMDDYEEEESYVNSDGQEYIWCLVGNIVAKHYFGEEKSIKIGTKQFKPNTKVYCFPAQWGDGYEDIQVIGRPRRFTKFIMIIMKSKYIANWRVQKVFHPYIITKMKENYGWDGSEKSKENILQMIQWLPEHTEKVSE